MVIQVKGEDLILRKRKEVKFWNKLERILSTTFYFFPETRKIIRDYKLL